MSAPYTADYLREEFETTLLGGKIGQSEASIGLNDAYGGEMG